MNIGLEKRLALLKARIGGNPIILHLPDGTTRQISGSSRHFLKLAALLDGDTESPLDSEVDWLRSAIRIDETAACFPCSKACFKAR